jgi:hypothetical protein
MKERVQENRKKFAWNYSFASCFWQRVLDNFMRHVEESYSRNMQYSVEIYGEKIQDNKQQTKLFETAPVI